MKSTHTLSLLFLLSLIYIFSACGYVQKTNPLSETTNLILDLNGPDTVVIKNFISTNTDITINWTDPLNEDFDHVLVSWTPDGTTPVKVAKGDETLIASVTDHRNTAFTVTLIAVDASGNQSDPTTFLIDPPQSLMTYTHFIYTADDLNAIRGNVPGYPNWRYQDHYYLMADIDLSSYPNWPTIGYFTGILDGNGYTITNLTISAPAKMYAGLFSRIQPSSILRNITLDTCNINGRMYVGSLLGSNVGTITNCKVLNSVVSGESYIGGLMGENSSSLDTSNCSVINTTVTATNTDAGGLIGRQSASAKIQECHTSFVNVSATQMVAGGLIGYSDSNLTIDRCSATDININSQFMVSGLVGHALDTLTVLNSFVANGTISCRAIAGGLIGRSLNCDTSISDSYSIIDANGEMYIGGLWGITHGTSVAVSINCYSAGTVTRSVGTGTGLGGLFGASNIIAITNCYFDKQPVPASIGDNGLGTFVPTVILQSNTLAGFDFATVWDIDPTINNGYPFLRSNAP